MILTFLYPSSIPPRDRKRFTQCVAFLKWREGCVKNIDSNTAQLLKGYKPVQKKESIFSSKGLQELMTL